MISKLNLCIRSSKSTFLHFHQIAIIEIIIRSREIPLYILLLSCYHFWVRVNQHKLCFFLKLIFVWVKLFSSHSNMYTNNAPIKFINIWWYAKYLWMLPGKIIFLSIFTSWFTSWTFPEKSSFLSIYNYLKLIYFPWRTENYKKNIETCVSWWWRLLSSFVHLNIVLISSSIWSLIFKRFFWDSCVNNTVPSVSKIISVICFAKFTQNKRLNNFHWANKTQRYV